MYISSDSSYTIDLIRNMAGKEFSIAIANLFLNGHTRKSVSERKDILSQVMIEVFIMEISDKVVVSWSSALGRYFVSFGMIIGVLWFLVTECLTRKDCFPK